MKRIFSFILLIVICFGGHSQTVEWSNQQKLKSKINYTQVLGENSSGLFIVRAKNNEFSNDLTIEKYKSNLALETTKDMEQPASSRIERVIVLESGLAQFTTSKNGSNGKIDLYLTLFDNTLTASTPRILMSVDANVMNSDKRILIRASGDKKWFTVMFTTYANDKTKSILNIHAFDAAFLQKYSRRFSLNASANDVNLVNMECDNQGNAFGLLNLPRDPKKTKFKDPKNYFLYAYYQTSDNMLEYEIGDNLVHINNIALVVNNYAKIVNVAGFYSHNNDNNNVGHFFYKLDIPSTEMNLKMMDAFDVSFVSKVVGNMRNQTGNTLSDLHIRKLVPNSDGGCTIIAEKYYETRQAYTYHVNGFPQTNYRTVYNYDEIIVLARKGDGTIRFKDFIKKTHSSLNDGGYYSSFVTILNNDKISLVYNFDVTTDSDIILSTINNKGEVDTKVLIKSMSYYVTIMPPESRQVTANSAIITSLKDRRFCLMRLTL